MKPRSLPEACSIKSKKHSEPRSSPRSLLFPSQRCCHDQNRSRGPQSSIPARTSTPGQACSRARPPGQSLLCIPRRCFSHRAARGPDDKLATCHRNQLHSHLSTAAGVGPPSKLPCKQQPPAQQRKKTAQKPALRCVTQSDCPCCCGAHRCHDKNKLRDKNTARAERRGHREGISNPRENEGSRGQRYFTGQANRLLFKT